MTPKELHFSRASCSCLLAVILLCMNGCAARRPTIPAENDPTGFSGSVTSFFEDSPAQHLLRADNAGEPTITRHADCGSVYPRGGGRFLLSRDVSSPGVADSVRLSTLQDDDNDSFGGSMLAKRNGKVKMDAKKQRPVGPLTMRQCVMSEQVDNTAAAVNPPPVSAESANPPAAAAYSAKAVEDAIITFLSRHQNRPKITDLLIRSGLFDLLTHGIIRLKTESVEDELMTAFFRDHILLRNWTKEQVDELNEEDADLASEIEALKEERKAIDLELDEFRHPRPPPVPAPPLAPDAAGLTGTLPGGPPGKGAPPAAGAAPGKGGGASVASNKAQPKA
ncbi:hypothetical protein BV898_10083 [Hypsibius exemplaris]|uniref:Uncharacterized protein n=1 Tax=Hypsibius exemplaris TaxID=2072580 RepID=A0A1W0WKX8_HYPEX|nr:hypothetical protein BV898_10083 [Hypsibius exemplaris]